MFCLILVILYNTVFRTGRPPVTMNAYQWCEICLTDLFFFPRHNREFSSLATRVTTIKNTWRWRYTQLNGSHSADLITAVYLPPATQSRLLDLSVLVTGTAFVTYNIPQQCTSISIMHISSNNNANIGRAEKNRNRARYGESSVGNNVGSNKWVRPNSNRWCYMEIYLQ